MPNQYSEIEALVGRVMSDEYLYAHVWAYKREPSTASKLIDMIMLMIIADRENHGGAYEMQIEFFLDKLLHAAIDHCMYEPQHSTIRSRLHEIVGGTCRITKPSMMQHFNNFSRSRVSDNFEEFILNGLLFTCFDRDIPNLISPNHPHLREECRSMVTRAKVVKISDIGTERNMDVLMIRSWIDHHVRRISKWVGSCPDTTRWEDGMVTQMNVLFQTAGVVLCSRASSSIPLTNIARRVRPETITTM